MWSALLDVFERLSITTFIYAALSSVIPWVIYRIIISVRNYGDPPWKKEFEERPVKEENTDRV